MTHARILKWVNKVRREHFGKGPIKRLPRGEIGTRCCPIHNAFWPPETGGKVSYITIRWDDPNGRICLPSFVAEFVHAFDSGKYPELVKK